LIQRILFTLISDRFLSWLQSSSIQNDSALLRKQGIAIYYYSIEIIYEMNVIFQIFLYTPSPILESK